MKLVLVCVVAIALWILYHKLFKVIYVNAFWSIAKEVVICLFLSFVVVAVLPQYLLNKNDDSQKVITSDYGKSGVTAENEISKSDEPYYYGEYHNLSTLNAADFEECTIIVGTYENDPRYLHITGKANNGEWQAFDVMVEHPAGNTVIFSCDNGPDFGANYYLTFNEENHTLVVEQEIIDSPPSNSIPLFSGEYVDKEEFQRLRAEKGTVIDTNSAETISSVDPLEDIPENGEFKRFISNEPCIEVYDGNEVEHQGIVSIKNIIENGQNTLYVSVDTGGKNVDGSLYFDTMLFNGVFQPTNDKSVWFGSDGEDSFTLTYYGTYLELIETSDNPRFQNMSGLYSLIG